MKLEFAGINSLFSVAGGVTVLVESESGGALGCNCEINCASEIDVLSTIMNIVMGMRIINLPV
jgi:hypothetical protein